MLQDVETTRYSQPYSSATGCRVGEMEAARVSDLDESRNGTVTRGYYSQSLGWRSSTSSYNPRVYVVCAK